MAAENSTGKAPGIKLAHAYVQVVPDMTGFGAQVASTLTGEVSNKAEQASNKAGTRAGNAFTRHALAGLNRFGTAGAKAAAQAGQATGGTFSQFAAAGISLIGNAGAQIALQAFATISGALGDAAARVDTLNNFPKIMQNLGFNATDAAKSIEQISRSLDGLPSSTDSVASMVVALAPLTPDLQSATDIALAFNNALLAGGASTQEQSNALEQYTQMLAAGKPDMMAWRSLQSAMPGQLNQVAQAMLGAGKNSLDLYEALQAGTVSFDDFNRAVVRLNSEGVDGLASFQHQAESATRGIGTALQNVRNRVVKAVATVIQAVGSERIAGAINGFSSGFGSVASVVAGAVGALVPVLTPVVTLFCVLAGAVARFAALVVRVVGPVLGVACAGLSVLSGILSRLAQWVDSVTQAFYGWLSELVGDNWLTLVPGWCTQAVQALQALYTVAAGVFSGVSALLVGSVQEAVGVLVGAWSQCVRVLAPCWQAIRSGAVAAFNGLAGAVSGAVSSVCGLVSGLKDRVCGVFAGAGSWLFAAGCSVINGFKDGLVHAFQGVMSFISGIGSWIVQHKGPISYDRRMLVPAGRVIMRGLESGLRDGFTGVRHQVAGVNSWLSSNFSAASTPTVRTPSAPVSAVGTTVSVAGIGTVAREVRLLRESMPRFIADYTPVPSTRGLARLNK